ncbi:DUF4174 domain-containing protein [Vibrio sp. T187]|uniref:DUF4174 domain-containing protein n=1 Tax=Vibrio TaxID=662 RepID=UPI0010C93B2E|nr:MULTISPECIES: DUF4174 domain-containing protein [Vibrio]MBW3698127.1 DUF4174 domain-containing protein [Vibrio sp. T187]
MWRLLTLVLALTVFATPTHSYPAYGKHLPHRSVIYFAPTQDSLVTQFLKEVLINNCQLDERDIVTMVITEDGFTMPSWIEEEFNLKAVATIYDIPKGAHTAILIGKDGQEKYRWNGETNWQYLTDLIDKMPKRQYEMQRQASRCSI